MKCTDKIGGGFYMNKRSVAIDSDTYQHIISTIKSGFDYQGVKYQPNVRIATILVLVYNIGLRIGDVLNITMNSLMKDGGEYRLNVYKKNTEKCHNFTVPNEMFHFIHDYAFENNISPEARLFPISKCAVLKHLRAVCEYLGLESIGTHSFRKSFATNAYKDSKQNIELVKTLLQHSSVIVTQRYIGVWGGGIRESIRRSTPNKLCSRL